MDPFLAQITTSQWPILFSAIAGGVGLLGIAASLMAHASIKRDRASITDADSTLTSSEAWEGSHTFSEHELSEWFQKTRIQDESGVADIIRACWSAWLGARATTLTELHVLVARRERSKTPARLSAGIAALLLVIGIVGTLFSIKPVLKAFQFRISNPEGAVPISDDPALSNVAESTELVNSLMHSLGDAFLPSLVALIATIIVVMFRGVYSLGLNRYTLELDRFAMRTVLPHFRPRSIADEYEEVRTTFGSLAKTIGDREQKFDQVVVQLTKFVENMGPTLEGLDKGIDQLSTAANTLATKSNSIATTLTLTLGKKSPLYGAVEGFEGIFSRTNEQLDKLSDQVEGIQADHRKNRDLMLETLEEVSEVIGKVSSGHEADRKNILGMIAEMKATVSKLPAETIGAARQSFDDGMAIMRGSLKESLSHQARETTATNQEIGNKTKATLELISNSLTATMDEIHASIKTVPKAIDDMTNALNQKSVVEKQAIDSIRSVEADTKSELHSALQEAVRSIIAANPPVPKNSFIEPNQSPQPPNSGSEIPDPRAGMMKRFFGGPKS